MEINVNYFPLDPLASQLVQPVLVDILKTLSGVRLKQGTHSKQVLTDCVINIVTY